MELDGSLLHSQVPATCPLSYTILPIALVPSYIIETTASIPSYSFMPIALVHSYIIVPVVPIPSYTILSVASSYFRTPLRSSCAYRPYTVRSESRSALYSTRLLSVGAAKSACIVIAHARLMN